MSFRTFHRDRFDVEERVVNEFGDNDRDAGWLGIDEVAGIDRFVAVVVVVIDEVDPCLHDIV